ncbi:MAG: caspase family protein [Bacteroidales bacterium]|nr:caspase family protein [Bacteroidales bacterium]
MKIEFLLLFLLVLAVYAEAQNIIPEIREKSGEVEYVIRSVDANATTDIDYITRIVVEIENKALEKKKILLNKAYLKNESGSVYKLKSIDRGKKRMLPEEKYEVSMNFERASGIVSFVVPSSVEMKNIDVSYSWEVETETIEEDKDKKHLVDIIEPVMKEYKKGIYKLYHEITPDLGYITLSDVRRSDPRDEFLTKKEKYDGYVEWLDSETKRIELPPYFNSDNINDSLWDLRFWGRYQNTKFRLEQKYNSNQDNITKQTLSNGYYIGKVSGYKRQGLGMYVWESGGSYLGEWNDNDRSGMGYEFSDDSIYYVGQYKNDKREGKGFYYWQTSRLKYLGFYSEKYLGDFSEGSLKEGIKYCPEYYYVGDFNGWNFGERGMILYKSGDCYVGEWSSAQEEGFGTEYWANGEKLVYQGNFHDGKFHGRGIMLMRDGSVQMGKWEYGHYKGNPEIITAEELWDFPIALPYIVIAQHIVDKEINDWAKRRMNETPEDWRKRIKDENIKLRTNDTLLPWIRDDYLKNTASKSRLNMKLYGYDPRNENFLIVDSTFGNMIVDVKKDEANKFKELWESKSLEFVPTYFFNGSSVEIKTISFVNNGREIARVNNKLNHVVIVDVDPYIDKKIIEGGTTQGGEEPVVGVEKLVSDVDTAIPITNIRRERPCYVLIIANENYKYVSNVPYALNDGKVFEDYCKKTLGIRNDNDRIDILKDGSLEEINEKVEKMIKFVNAGDGDMDVIFYYAGHAFPDRDNTYLLPIGGTTTGYKLSVLYDKLSALKAKSVVCFLDACFSGDVLASEGSRAVRIGHNMEIPDGAGNLVVITASSAEEYANPIKTEGHGMFTYFLLKKLKDSKGKINLGDLFEYVRENVKNESNKSGKLQIPQVMPSNSMKEVWRKMKL